MKKRIAVICPSSYSQVMPMIELAKSLKDKELDVIFCVSIDFKETVISNNLNFYELNFKKIVNTGIAQTSEGSNEERKRLNEFFEATKKGALETLIFQTNQRQKDLLSDPLFVIEEIRKLINIINPDLFLVNHLNFSVTLAMYCLNLNYISFVPGHPTQLPEEEGQYGVPSMLPSEIKFDSNLYTKLELEASTIEISFTEIFNKTIKIINSNLLEIENAFKLTSSKIVIFNYPDFNNTHKDIINKTFLEYSFNNQKLDYVWEKIIDKNKDKFKILLTFGTFLSARVDVLEKCINIIKNSFKDILLIVSGGGNKELNKYNSDNIIISEFLPQTAILKDIDLVINHGGGNTFTESLFYSKSMIIMPFSTDQFMVANDLKNNNLGKILDPNYFTEDELINSINQFYKKINISINNKTNKIQLRNDSIEKIKNIIKNI